MKQDDGGPAFPKPDCNSYHGELGMSLRDWFAGQALIGLLSMPDIEDDQRSMQDVIDTAFYYADGMLKRRLKENPE